ncbi:hypothetical protein [Paraburkholderia susongensis]|uniref:Uncharacterized protein n=1 Tax=Paraburkholderia susongensis TaxID=1515439 RepID=A0A1X7KNN1_9BURK|nr:hypothetical protein [Paraburkholderia susongensis]SMG42983.1 hypothetical protein SAMN06265784_104129 [Paraburkholderia susongensis]
MHRDSIRFRDVWAAPGSALHQALTDGDTEKASAIHRQCEHDMWKSQGESLYHLVAINERSGRKVYLTGYPMLHHMCCVMKSKTSTHKDVRIQLEEVAA